MQRLFLIILAFSLVHCTVRATLHFTEEDYKKILENFRNLSPNNRFHSLRPRSGDEVQFEKNSKFYLVKFEAAGIDQPIGEEWDLLGSDEDGATQTWGSRSSGSPYCSITLRVRELSPSAAVEGSAAFDEAPRSGETASPSKEVLSFIQTYRHKLKTLEQLRTHKTPLRTTGNPQNIVVKNTIQPPPQVDYGLNTDMNIEYPYTASEGHLSLVLGQPVITSIKDLEGQYKKSLENFFRTYTLYTFPPLSDEFGKSLPDHRLENFISSLANILKEERSFPAQWTVLYHATTGLSGIFFDILTKLKHILAGKNIPTSTVMRVLDKAFEGYEKAENLAHIIDFNTTDHSDKFREKGLSANLYIMGNPYEMGESTFMALMRTLSIKSTHPKEVEEIFNSHLKNLNLDIEKYMGVFQEIMGCSPGEEARLYQFFVHPGYVGQLAYAAGPYGRKLLWKTGENPSVYPLEEQLTQLKKAPENFEDFFKNQELFYTPEFFSDAGASSSFLKINPNTLQARVLLKPEWINNPEIVQIKTYHFGPNKALNTEKADRWNKNLEKMLEEDVAKWLASGAIAHEDFSKQNQIGRIAKEIGLIKRGGPKKLEK